MLLFICLPNARKSSYLVARSPPTVLTLYWYLKRHGTWHTGVDYNDVNKISIRKAYPLHCIDGLLEQLKQTTYFSNGFKSCYWTRISEKSLLRQYMG